MALLFPGLLVDHGVIAAHVISKSRDGSSVADPRGVTIKTVDNSQQETVWNNNIVNCRSTGLVPDPFTGRVLTLGDTTGNTTNVPLELINAQGADHQDLMDSIFGLGYARCLTSKRIGAIVRAAVQQVLAAKTPEDLLVVYEKYRDALNEVAPVGFYTGKDAVELALGVGVSRPQIWESDRVVDYIKLIDPTVQYTNSWFLRRALEGAYPGVSSSVIIQAVKAVEEAYVKRELQRTAAEAAMAAAEGSIVL
jgi:hypothetical protein